MVLFIGLVFVAFSQKDKAFMVFETEDDNISGICFAKNGGALAVADNNTVKVFSMETKALIAEFKNGHKKQILSIDISQDSLLLASGGKDSTITIWDFTDNKILSTLSYHKGIVTSVKFSPDGRYLVSGATDDKVYLYDIAQKKVIKEYTGHNDDVTSVDFSPGGKLFASASADESIRIYTVEDNYYTVSLEGHKSWVRDISFSEDSAKLISCGDDSKIITWNISDLNNIYKESQKKLNSGWILSVEFNEDSQTYVSGSFNGNVKITLHFGGYHLKLGVPVNQALFQPGQGYYLKIALATRGKGVILVDQLNSFKVTGFSK